MIYLLENLVVPYRMWETDPTFDEIHDEVRDEVNMEVEGQIKLHIWPIYRHLKSTIRQYLEFHALHR
jgi:hypothetical protein